ncbi:hypothetical protein BC831DRAFT_516559 [Entophlyctis helioformis]|nr:hypothetical protein BC831DRAFT_516559 [Entophlyctis helioformis]
MATPESTTTAALEARFAEMQERKMAALRQLAEAGAVENAASFFEASVDKHRDLPCVFAVDHAARYTFGELDAAANRIAHWGSSIGLAQLQTVALLMENRPEYLAMTMGFAKIGVTIALINTNLKGSLLHHAINVSGARVVVASVNKLANWASIDVASPFDTPKDVYWYAGQDTPVPLDTVLAAVPSNTASPPDSSISRNTYVNGIFHHALGPDVLASQRADRPPSSVRNQVTSRTPLYYIFTSGTTGPSKAAKFSHRRFIGAAVTWAGPSGLKTGDRYYITLPLYHGNAGVVAVAPCYLLGNTIVLREKFSVSNFFKDIREHQCVATIYIGELWRYLFTLPTQPNEGTPSFSPLRVAIGNGLRSDIWTDVCRRFCITQVVEHYGSTEMPGDAVLNYFNKPGSCGFLPLELAKQKSMTGEGGMLVRYDVEEDAVMRTDDGRCIACGPGEIGEMIMRLPGGVYDGYVGENATRRKLYENVFEDGDMWWSSGDLLKMDEQGFFYFVDRTGDSFRWKGENVSTHEIQVVVGAFPGVLEVNVYGIRIPHSDGRAGMASIVLDPSTPPSAFDLAKFTAHLEQLPTYARPIFIRLRQREHEKTSTLKFQKFQYVQQGYDPQRTEGDAVYVFWPTSRSWEAVDEQVVARLAAGDVRF